MAEKKHDTGFTVTDRRMFTEDGELRKDKDKDVDQVSKTSTTATPAQNAAPSNVSTIHSAGDGGSVAHDVPPAPSPDDQQAQADAYRQSSKDLDSRVELSGGSAKDFEMSFERFLASLYMTAMLQLGLMHEQGGQPHVDIIGARQTIDTLSLLGEKTKGNLTRTEENFLQNSLYELRMAYVEVTNALSRPPQPGAATGTGGR